MNLEIEILSKKDLEKNIAIIEDGHTFTNSLVFAKEFGFMHKDVLKKIRNLMALSSTIEIYFKESIYKTKRNRQYPYFEITRDGYNTLLMQMGEGKTEESRNRIFNKQQLFIKIFNAMETALFEKRDLECIRQAKQIEKQSEKIIELTVNNMKTYKDGNVSLRKYLKDKGVEVAEETIWELLEEKGIVGSMQVMMKKRVLINATMGRQDSSTSGISFNPRALDDILSDFVKTEPNLFTSFDDDED